MAGAHLKNATVMKNGIPITHRNKILSMSPSRTLMTIEQDLIQGAGNGTQYLRNQINVLETMAERRRHTLEVSNVNRV